MSGSRSLAQEETGAVAQESSEDPALTRAVLLALAPAGRRAALEADLRRRAAVALEIPAERIDAAQPLTALGLDSLAAVELSNGLASDLGAAPSLSRLLDGASLAHVAGELLAALEAARASGDGDKVAANATAPAWEVEASLFAADWNEEENLAAAAQARTEAASATRDQGAAIDVDTEPHGAALADSWQTPVLTHGQRSLWFLARMAPESPAYVIAGAARALGEIDSTALRRSLEALVARHDALRTTFAADEIAEAGGPTARVDPCGGLDYVEEDAAAWSPERLEQRTAHEAHRPFDLSRGPLLRAALLRGAPGGDRLVLAVHHVAADLWSLEVLLAELDALYRGGGHADLPPLPLRHADFACWQAERLAGPRGERLWEFWRQALQGRGGSLPRLELPADRPRPRAQSFRGAAEPVPLPGGVAAELRAVGRSRGATLFATLLAGFQALLGRWSGQEELLVGSPTSGRSERGRELAGLVGYFVNPVVLYADLGGDPSFEGHLARTRAATLAAFAHADFPFPLLAERLQPERDPGRSPVFQAMFALERARGALRDLPAFALQRAGARLDLGGLELESLPLPQTTSQFDVTFLAAELADGEVAASLHYSTDLFDAATAGRMAGHLARLLSAAAAAPDAPLWELPVLSAEEMEELISASGSTAEHPLEGMQPVHALFAERARDRPGAGAIVDGAVRLTYAELDAAADRLARRLCRLGVGPEVAVGILLEAGAERVVAILAALKAGGGYLSLDPSHPEERLARMLAGARCPVLVTRGGLGAPIAATIADAGALVLSLDVDLVTEDREIQPAGTSGPENLAYVIYTSGSTGEPKGIALGHAGLANLLACHYRLFPVGPGDRTTWLAGPAFDASVWELWFALAAGAELHVPPRGLAADPDRLLAWMEAQELTQAFLPTPIAELIFARGSRLPASLRRLFVGGARLHRRPPEGTACEVVDCYGPAEATVISVWGRVEAGGADLGPAPIGRPVDNLRAYVLDPRLQPVPRGIVGELCLAGAGLARGYLGRPDLTAARFRPDPFAGEPGGRLYLTGDLARRLPGGELDCFGRVDDQVKVRGVRVEPGEVESALACHPAVRQAVVMPREDEPGGLYLAGYVVPAGEAPAAEELRAFLREGLPEAMVPTRFVFLPELPLTPNGKLDRAALPPPGWAELDSFVAPGTEVEEILAGIWREVLRVERVGIYDNFFDLGGHSLKVHQVLARVREDFEVEVPLASFFESPTIAGLAQALARELMAQADEEALAEILEEIQEIE